MSDFEYYSEMAQGAKNLKSAQKARQLKKAVLNEVDKALKLYEKDLATDRAKVMAEIEKVGDYSVYDAKNKCYVIEFEGNKPSGIRFMGRGGHFNLAEDGKTIKGMDISTRSISYYGGNDDNVRVKYDSNRGFTCYDRNHSRELFSITADDKVTLYSEGEISAIVHPDNTQEFYTSGSEYDVKHVIDKEKNVNITSANEKIKLQRLSEKEDIHFLGGRVSRVDDLNKGTTTLYGYFEDGKVKEKVYLPDGGNTEKRITVEYYGDGKHVQKVTNVDGRETFLRPDGTKDTVQQLNIERTGSVCRYDADGKTVVWKGELRNGNLAMVQDGKGNKVNYNLDGSIASAIDVQGNETTYFPEKMAERLGKTKECNHKEIGKISHEDDGRLTITIQDDLHDGWLKCDKNGKVLSYLEPGENWDGFNAFYKEDGKTIDRIVGANNELIDINSERGQKIIKSLDDMMKEKMPKIKEYVQSEKTVQEFSRHMQTEFKNYKEEIRSGGFTEKYAKELKEVIEKEERVAVAKETAKQAEQAVTSATEKVATKSAMKATAAKAGEKVAKTVKTAGKAAKETLLAANKAYDDTFDAIMKWGDKHAPQWMNKVEEKTVQKAAEKFMKTKSGQAIAKQIEKKVGKEVAASIAKKIPILCLGVGAACVYDRLKDGEYMKALGEGTSALVANIPGLGTLASIGLDGAMLSDDLKVFEHGVTPKDPNSHVAAESTFVDKPIIVNQEKLVKKVDKAAEAKKKAEEKKKAEQFAKNLYQYGGRQDNTWGS